MGFFDTIFGRQQKKVTATTQPKKASLDIPFQSKQLPINPPGAKVYANSLDTKWVDATQTTDLGKGATKSQISKSLGISNPKATSAAINDAALIPTGQRKNDVRGNHNGGKYNLDIQVSKYDPKDIPIVTKQLNENSTTIGKNKYQYNSSSGEKITYSVKPNEIVK